MNPAAAVTRLLSMRLGLSAELFGSGAVERAVEAALTQADKAGCIERLLRGEGEEWESVVDEVVVRESWFFRDREPFRYLASYVTNEWRVAHPTENFRVLCIPCGSGEEPLSAAIMLLDAGLEADRICIDAVDISNRTLQIAKRGIYGKNSFREAPICSEERYIVRCPEGWRVREEVANLVHFEKGNLLDLTLFRQRAPYDAVFCRNAMIYFRQPVRKNVITSLRDLLTDGGLLFTGHTELVPFLQAGFMAVAHPHSFACRRKVTEAKQISLRAQDGKKRATGASPKREWRNAAALSEENSNGASALPFSARDAEQLADCGKLEAASAVCRRILDTGSQDPDVYSLLGVISQSSGNMDSAQELFRKALFLDPYHYRSLVHLSLLCEWNGDPVGSGRYRARAERIALRQAGETNNKL